MNPALVLTPLLLFGLGLLFVLPILLKLLKTCKVEEISADWLENFSCSSYHAMEGLLSDEDFDFLSRQPGFDLSLYRKLRRDRLNIFKQYLNRLIVDFNRLHAAARFLLAQSSEDHSELVTRLLWLKVRFSIAVVEAQFSYGLCCLGFRCLAVKSAIRHLEEMSAQLSAIPAAHAA
ncbi:MAG: hypothetical protein JOY54_17095 [Acidobacteriaceae bacterium]|nr:hypothetical protein [Acidobacteriaceae bacterium]